MVWKVWRYCYWWSWASSWSRENFSIWYDILEKKKLNYVESSFFSAEKHLILGTADSFGLFLSLLRGYFDRDTLDMACFYTSRAVFPYLMIYNIACALRAYNTMARHIADRRSTSTLVLSSSSADIILFPSLPLMNFLCFLILTCQRASADLFCTLKAHYEDALKQASSWKPVSTLFVSKF